MKSRSQFVTLADSFIIEFWKLLKLPYCKKTELTALMFCYWNLRDTTYSSSDDQFFLDSETFGMYLSYIRTKIFIPLFPYFSNV